MKVLTRLASFLAIIVSAAGDTASISTLSTVCVQAIDSASSEITPLAQIQFDTTNFDVEFISYEAPYLSPPSFLTRIGICDATEQSWLSSTTVTSTESFSKGQAPTIMISIDTRGNVFGVTCKSAQIDAGQTRDFGPKAKIVKMKQGMRPELNKPIMVSKEGILEAEVQEKTFMQKYWWVGLSLIVFLLATGGGDK